MKINGKVHCFFEQSGTFKNEFIKLGIHAEDYDIQNNFGETDHIIDLFAEIEKGYEGQPSLWDEISTDDLIMAFFPCIFFCENNQLYFMGAHRNLERYSKKEKADTILKRSQDRAYFYELALKMFTLCDIRGIRVRPIILPHDYWKPMSEPSRRNRMGRTILYIYLIHLYGLTILYAASVRKTK
ncbi:MAG: hypothetical protein J5510_08380 [Prevotella sp.]|nr:hypothetical protein [Prevotella sp.]